MTSHCQASHDAHAVFLAATQKGKRIRNDEKEKARLHLLRSSKGQAAAGAERQ
jgi:hypothetical protein